MSGPKEKVPKKLVTEGELLMDIRNILLHTLPALAKKPPIWKRRWVHFILLVLLSLFVVDFGFGRRGSCDLVVTDGAAIRLVKMPPPDWEAYGLEAIPEYWAVGNPEGESAGVFEIGLVARTVTYKQSVVRAVAGSDGGEARLEFADVPLVVKCPTIVSLKPAEGSYGSGRIRESVVRTYALEVGGKKVPLYMFVDGERGEGELVVEVIPRLGMGRFRANVAAALGMFSWNRGGDSE